MRPRALLAAGVALTASVPLYLWAGSRLVRGHDSFQYYSTQQVFASNAAQGGGVALWLPYSTQGTASAWHAPWQAGFLQCLILFAGPLLKGVDFHPLFLAGMFVDELIFLAGMWCLGRRLYRTAPAAAFAAMAAVGSCVWVDQIWYNFHSFYVVPLVLALLHAYLDDGRRTQLFLAGNLFAVHFLGNLPYLPIITAFFIVLYFVCFGAVNHRRVRAFRPRWVDLLALGGVGATLALVVGLLFADSGEAVIRGYGREVSGGVSLNEFVTYGGHLNPLKYLEFVTGVPVSLDYTLFCGFPTLGFAALAFVNGPDRRTLHLASTLGLVVVLSTGFLGLVAMLAYYLPGMRFFRHLGLIAPFAKLLLVLLGGAGVDHLAVGRVPRRAHYVIAWVAAMLGLALAATAAAPVSVRTAIGTFLLTSGTGADDEPVITDGGVTAALYLLGAIGALATAVVLWRAAALPRPRRTLLALLVVHALPLLAWKIAIAHIETFPLAPEQSALQRLDAIPYVPRRAADCTEGGRFRILRDPLFNRQAHGRYYAHGEMYWSTDAYLRLDLPASRFRTTDWMLPLDDLIRAYEHKSLRDQTIPLASQHKFFVLKFPLDAPSAPKLVGLSLDKIQLFATAHSVASADEAARLIGDPHYAGDLLFLVGGGGTSWMGGPLDANERLDAHPEVAEFDANHIVIRVTAPRGAWLSYADVWHPSWRATVNGAPVRVERSSLAYKAVGLVPGENTVEFRFVSPVRLWCFRLLSLNAIAWIAGVLCVLWRELRRSEWSSSARVSDSDSPPARC